MPELRAVVGFGLKFNRILAKGIRQLKRPAKVLNEIWPLMKTDTKLVNIICLFLFFISRNIYF